MEGASWKMVYKTIQGDTWDRIAYEQLGNEEYMKELIRANLEYAEVLVFSAGVLLEIPEVEKEEKELESDVIPEWRAEAMENQDMDYDPYDDFSEEE